MTLSDDIRKLALRFDGDVEATDVMQRAADANERMKEALRPFARLEVPEKPEGNAGFYSLRFADIRNARTIRQEVS